MATNKRLIKSNDEGGGVVPLSFNTVTWTGNNSTQSITGVGFQPDLVWLKGRNNASWTHFLQDSIRGAENFLISSSTAAEGTTTPHIVDSFDTDGFTIKDNGNSNATGDTYVAWNFKAGGAPTVGNPYMIDGVGYSTASAANLNAGTLTPTEASINKQSGFSIIRVPSDLPSNSSYSHGLDATPEFIITKSISDSGSWYSWHKDIGIQYIILNSSNAAGSGEYFRPNATTVLNPNAGRLQVGNDTIIYCFHSVAGFSKFGSYDGNGTSQTIYTTDDGTAGGANGFEPAFVMLKRTNGAGGNWAMADNKRTDGELLANVIDAERNENTPDFISNGFTMTTNRYNDTGEEWIYMAFANQF